MICHYPVFGICGYSGSGKTTVIEQVARILVQRGLRVGVVKHDVHGLSIDREGKDTDRFFKAGADVLIRGPEQAFLRSHRRGGGMPLAVVLRAMCPHYDVILAEGHKTTPLPYKVWVLADNEKEPPAEATGISRVLGRDEDRVRIVMAMIDAWLPQVWREPPVYAGILAGGNSHGVGWPMDGPAPDRTTCLARTAESVRPYVDGIAILGAGEIPTSIASVPLLCDVPGVEGPLAGMLAATRWSPLTCWLFLPGDAPPISVGAIRWLLDHRAPGVWAVLPRLTGAPALDPLPFYCDLRAAPLLERVSRPVELAGQEHVLTPTAPEEIQALRRRVDRD